MTTHFLPQRYRHISWAGIMLAILISSNVALPSARAQQTGGAPLITAVTPTNGGPGQAVRIIGQGFTSLNVISLEGPEASYPLGESTDGTIVTFIVPTLVPGVYQLSLNTMHGVTSNTAVFAITADAPQPLPPLPAPTPRPTIVPPPLPSPVPPTTPLPTLPPIPTPFPTASPLPPLPPLPCPWWQWWCDTGPVATREYVALGDSVAVGLTSLYGYTYQYRDFLENTTGVPVNLTNLGQTAWSSSHLVQALRTNAGWRQAVANADYVTWNIGGKDVLDARELYQARQCGGSDNQQCLRDTTARLQANWSGIVNEIRTLRAGNVTTVQTMDLYNPFVSVDRQRDSWPNDAGSDWHVLQPYLTHINIYLFTTASQAGIRVAPVFTEFNGRDGSEDPRLKGYISFDGFHPNLLGHAVISGLLADQQPAF